mmetsp:Transcript_26997/g.45532  ORF Transcript_26997/g.45532 Transcript_26997/m.45532 type:complete len:210 (+) Transcript_26997:865-1494(+)
MDTLKAMLQREDQLRLSPETLKLYELHGNTHYGAITTAIQEQVSREFGMTRKIAIPDNYTNGYIEDDATMANPEKIVEVGVMLLRCAEQFASNEEELAEINALSLYRRHNRCVDGPLRVGDRVPLLEGPLHLLNESLTTVLLFQYLCADGLHAFQLPPQPPAQQHVRPTTGTDHIPLSPPWQQDHTVDTELTLLREFGKPIIVLAGSYS